MHTPPLYPHLYHHQSNTLLPPLHYFTPVTFTREKMPPKKQSQNYGTWIKCEFCDERGPPDTINLHEVTCPQKRDRSLLSGMQRKPKVDTRISDMQKNLIKPNPLPPPVTKKPPPPPPPPAGGAV